MKAKILKAHRINFKELSNGIILADNDDGTYINITDWSLNKLYKWLGY